MKVAVISDIHSNLEALTAVLDDIEKRNDVDKRRIICVGDLVSYGANPNECVYIARKRCEYIVKGNHDEAIGNVDFRLAFNNEAQETLEWTEKTLTEENKNYLKNLPETISEKDLFIVHASPCSHLEEYILEKNLESKFYEFSSLSENIILMGHTHQPYIKTINNKMLINPGSVGQPRDKDPRASYAILDLEKKEAEIIRINYNVEEAIKKILNANLPKWHADRLRFGM